jgi:hypothetical protein
MFTNHYGRSLLPNENRLCTTISWFWINIR